jgi:hypothetical protein
MAANGGHHKVLAVLIDAHADANKLSQGWPATYVAVR